MRPRVERLNGAAISVMAEPSRSRTLIREDSSLGDINASAVRQQRRWLGRRPMRRWRRTWSAPFGANAVERGDGLTHLGDRHVGKDEA